MTFGLVVLWLVVIVITWGINQRINTTQELLKTTIKTQRGMLETLQKLVRR